MFPAPQAYVQIIEGSEMEEDQEHGVQITAQVSSFDVLLTRLVEREQHIAEESNSTYKYKVYLDHSKRAREDLSAEEKKDLTQLVDNQLKHDAKLCPLCEKQSKDRNDTVRHLRQVHDVTLFITYDRNSSKIQRRSKQAASPVPQLS